MDLFTKNMPKSCLGAPGLDFVAVWGSPNASWAALGQSWGPLGRSWEPLGRVLGASWASLERSWVSPGCQMLPKRAPDSISEGSGSVRGRVGSSQSCIFRGFFIPAFSSNMVHEFLQEVHFKIHSSFSFTPCSAAVRAQHIRRLPKGEHRVSNRGSYIHISSFIYLYASIHASDSMHA